MSKLGMLLIAVLFAVVPGACASLGDLLALRDQIQQSGFEQINVEHNSTNGYDVLAIAALTPAAVATEQDVTRIATTVWQWRSSSSS